MEDTMRTRKTHERIAFETQRTVYRYHFLCDDNTTFSAIAATEKGAFCVLNAERPGMMADFTERTECPCPSLDVRRKNYGLRAQA